MSRPARRLPTPPVATTRPGRVIDASGLPTIGFGPKSIMWWGVVGFILIEGTTIGTAIGSYLYLSGIEPQWPPPRTALPGLLVPALKALLLLASVLPALLCDKAARRFDFRGMRRWVMVMAAFGLVAVALQFLELRTSGVRWDAHAYASAVWLVLIAYFLVLATDVADTVVFSVLLYKGPVKESHFPDASDNTVYWMFSVVMGILTSALVTIVPRL
jgi:cytochrome c oxidase subunit 1/cytochrome c oxidase subunit I+III